MAKLGCLQRCPPITLGHEVFISEVKSPEQSPINKNLPNLNRWVHTKDLEWAYVMIYKHYPEIEDEKVKRPPVGFAPGIGRHM